MIEGDVKATTFGQVNQRCVVFWDYENTQISYKQMHSKSPNRKAIDQWLHDNYSIIEKIVYIDVARANGIRSELRRMGWTIKDVESRQVDENQKDVIVKNALDIQLAVEAVAYAMKNPWDKVVIMSGDGDYIPVAIILNRENVRFDVLAVEGCISYGLKNFAERYYSLSDILEEKPSKKAPLKEESPVFAIFAINDDTALKIRNEIVDLIKSEGKISGPKGLTIFWKHTTAERLADLGVPTTKELIKKYPIIFGGITVRANTWFLAE